MPPGRHLAVKFYIGNKHLSIANCVLNFNFLALVVSEIIGGPKFTLGGGGPAPPDVPYLKYFDIPKYLPIPI